MWFCIAMAPLLSGRRWPEASGEMTEAAQTRAESRVGGPADA